MSGPLVSVCVPTWNGAAFLSEALGSVRAQTFQDFELLVVDDRSSDGTLELLASLSDSRWRLVENARRLGIPGNWNRCLELARGKYVKFLFQDDTLEPAAIARLLAAMVAVPEASLAFGRREIRHEGPDTDGLPLSLDDLRTYTGIQGRFYASINGPLSGADLVARALLDGQDLTINVVGEPSFVLLDREAALRAGGFHGGFAQLVDWDLWLRMAHQGPLVFADESLGVFRVHRGGQSASNHDSLRLRWEFAWLLYRLLRLYGPVLPHPMRRRLRSELGRYALHFVGETVRSLVPGRRRAPS